MQLEQDIYYNKSIPFKFRRKTLSFRASQHLFSNQQINVGTRHLLRSLGDAHPEQIRKILDVGCGYGPLGLTLKKLDFTRTVHLVDRDALAVAYTIQNAKLNKLSNAVVYGSLGFEAVPVSDFDLIVSHIPSKAGVPVITHFLEEARHYLAPDGLVAIVAIRPLTDIIQTRLGEIGATITHKAETADHTIFHYRFPSSTSKPSGNDLIENVYKRDAVKVSESGARFYITTVHGLPEYDNLSYETRQLLKTLKKTAVAPTPRTLVINPGQGHVAVGALKLKRPSHITLITRDLLSLTITHKNLVDNGFDAEKITTLHQVGAEVADKRPFDLILVQLPKGESQAEMMWWLNQAGAQLTSKGSMLVAGSSAAVTRIETAVKQEKQLRVIARRRHKGRSILTIQPQHF